MNFLLTVLLYSRYSFPISAVSKRSSKLALYLTTTNIIIKGIITESKLLRLIPMPNMAIHAPPYAGCLTNLYGPLLTIL